jgi:FixJ family two-component response regulator
MVFVIDDDPSFLTAIKRLLRARGYTFESFPSASEFLASGPKECHGCILVDLQMPGLTGLEFQQALSKTSNALPLVFLTGHGDIPSSVRAVKHGAEDFLTKPVRKEALFAAIDRALARNATERNERASQQAARARFETLTPREREVLAHVLQGKLNKQIATDLGTSERTIKAHRANIIAKLKVQSVAELVRLAQAAEFEG